MYTQKEDEKLLFAKKNSYRVDFEEENYFVKPKKKKTKRPFLYKTLIFVFCDYIQIRQNRKKHSHRM